MGRIIAAVVGIVFVAGGAWLHVQAALKPAWQIRSAQAWPQTTCTILHSEVVEGTDSDGDTTYDAYVAYSWRDGDAERRGDRIDFSFGGPGGDDAFEAVRAFPVGAQVPCWLDPADRAQAVLRREGVAVGGGLVAVLFLVAGLVMLYLELGQPRPPRARVAAGVLVARPRWGRQLVASTGALLGATPLAVSAYLLMELGRPGSAVLYAAIAAGALVLAAHQLGQWLTGLSLEVSPPRLALGETARLRWRMRAPFGVGRGTVRLVAYERVWRSDGSSTVMEERLIHEAHVADLDRAHAGAAVDVVVPRDGLPTLTAGRAMIEWSLAVHAELPRWPDLDLRVPIEVAPVAIELPRPRPPRHAAPVIDDTPWLVLDRARGDAAPVTYAPGEAITGVVGWTRGSPDAVRVEIRRTVKVVDGDPPVTDVVEAVDVATLPRIAAPGGDGPFRGVAASPDERGGPLGAREARELRLVAPAGPVSHGSSLLTITWALVVVVDGHDTRTLPIRIAT